MKTRRVFTILVAIVLVPFLLSWGTLLLIPGRAAARPVRPARCDRRANRRCSWRATSARHDAPRPQAPVSTTPIYSH